MADFAEWEWTCACCGKRQRGVPEVGYAAPDVARWAEGSDEATVHLQSDDFCVIETADQTDYFIRCYMEVPVLGAPKPLGIGVWSSLSEQNFRRYYDSFDDDDQENLGGMFGFLSNQLPYYPDTTNLHLRVMPCDGRVRPLVFVDSHNADHPLYRDQQSGLDANRAAEVLPAFAPCEGSA
ncbi:MAG: DUF2199 domain-containing protein [Paracoccaceae bacterium]|nr:DUF2199 domain-containing protein [Paracoccaceae bacterium]